MSRQLTRRVYVAAAVTSPTQRRLLVTRVVPSHGQAAGLPPPPAARPLSATDHRALWVLWALGEALNCLLGLDALALLEL